MVSMAVFTSIFINPRFLFGFGWILGGGRGERRVWFPSGYSGIGYINKRVIGSRIGYHFPGN